ncbi:hypothetical protein Tco_0148018 [Tanacetum coccineum]
MMGALSVEPSPHAKYMNGIREKSLICGGMFVTRIVRSFRVGEEDEEDDEAVKAAGGNAGNEGVGGSVDMYRNMSQGDWQVRQAQWMDQQDEHWGRFNTWMGQQEERANWMYDHTICQFQYMSTRDDLDPHLQIDPFPRREADYPPYGYTGHMPPGYEY